LTLHRCTSSFPRYPSFIDAVRDIDDALCMMFLFSSLPSNYRLPPQLIENCTRLSAEWQLYILHTRSLRKAFLSIKGVYYQAEVMDQPVTWLVPYQFTQNVRALTNQKTQLIFFQIPVDVDVRVMLTFLELYQTLLGFVLFKLYTDAGLVYPPPLDNQKDDGGAGIGALSLQDTGSRTGHSLPALEKPLDIDGRKITGKDVRKTIKSIGMSSGTDVADVDMSNAEPAVVEVDEEFTAHPSTSDTTMTVSLTTLKSLVTLPPPFASTLFAPYTFFLSRETSRPIFEFIVRSFGGRIGWPASSGSGSPFDETDDSITHAIIDRPLLQQTDETAVVRERRLRRKFVQPQWIVDCINSGRILLEEPYAQGKTLPPHLSPFGESADAYDPTSELFGASATMLDDLESESGKDVGMEHIANTIALTGGAAIVDSSTLRTAELAAEAAGVDYNMFEKEVNKLRSQTSGETVEDSEKDMNKMMMSNKQRKLYEKMKYSRRKREHEVRLLSSFHVVRAQRPPSGKIY
jgi:pescadillo